MRSPLGEAFTPPARNPGAAGSIPAGPAIRGLLNAARIHASKMCCQEGRKIYESLFTAASIASCSDLVVCRGGSLEE